MAPVHILAGKNFESWKVGKGGGNATVDAVQHVLYCRIVPGEMTATTAAPIVWHEPNRDG